MIAIKYSSSQQEEEIHLRSFEKRLFVISSVSCLFLLSLLKLTAEGIFYNMENYEF